MVRHPSTLDKAEREKYYWPLMNKMQEFLTPGSVEEKMYATPISAHGICQEGLPIAVQVFGYSKDLRANGFCHNALKPTCTQPKYSASAATSWKWQPLSAEIPPPPGR